MNLPFIQRCCAFIIINSYAMACSSSPATLGYSQVKTPDRTWAKISCGSRSVLFPEEWKQLNDGATGTMELTSKQGTVCLVVCSHIATGTSLKKYTLEKFTKITARMIRSGFSVSSVKNNVVSDITAGVAADPSSISGFAYELKAPPHLNSKQVLALSLFIKDSDLVLAISFEMEPKKYPSMKKGLQEIIGSLK